jgi:DNA-binding GntR family transcriptional regulator
MITRQPQSRGHAAQRRVKAASSSLTEQAYAQLEQMIATLELRPGAFVSEAELCERLGIGRTPVREAMQRLAREHLLQIMPRKGCVVSDCRFGEEMDVIEVRKPLERVIVHGAAARATPDQRRRFAGIADDMAAALDKDDFDAFARLDAEFNQLCLTACGNATATSMMRLISTQNRRFWFMHHGRTLPREGVESHVDIARAIASGEADEAVNATERLLAYVEDLAMKSSRV